MSHAIHDSGVGVAQQPDFSADVSGNEVWEANLHCRTKAYLLLHGQHGTRCDYETMCRQSQADVKRAVSDKLLAEHGPQEVLVNVTLTRSVLAQARPLILDARLPTDLGLLHFDGLKRVQGASVPASSTTYRSCSKVARRSTGSRNPSSNYAADFSATCRGSCQAKASSTAGDRAGPEPCGFPRTQPRSAV